MKQQVAGPWRLRWRRLRAHRAGMLSLGTLCLLVLFAVAGFPLQWLTAIDPNTTDLLARYDARNPGALKRLVAAGAQLRPFPVPVMEACLTASNEVNAEISAGNADYKKVLESMQAFRNDEYFWWQVAEFTYDNFMIRTRTRT